MVFTIITKSLSTLDIEMMYLILYMTTLILKYQTALFKMSIVKHKFKDSLKNCEYINNVRSSSSHSLPFTHKVLGILLAVDVYLTVSVFT